MIGKTISHYRIIEKLGKGGMGEVFRAEDLKLHRPVALKAMHDHFSHEAEWVARFQREAQVLASLNHPNIAAIYGFEDSGGKRFIVMELVEGETLAQRLLEGPLPVKEALQTCHQIAEGLEAAHEKGVIHRDLKPANVMLAGNGRIKILDFGLAKSVAVESVFAATQSATTIEGVTRAGAILGTTAYMSPEQVEGKSVDTRTDIWAFGCILYECLTGKAAFDGDTGPQTMAKVLEGTPDWKLLPAATPGSARELLQRCLQKNPRSRLRDIGDARIQIAECLSMQPESFPSGPRLPMRRVLTSAAMLLTGLIGGLLAMQYFGHRAFFNSKPVVRTSVKVEPGLSLWGYQPSYRPTPTRTAMAISSDAGFVVYSALEANPTAQDRPRLYLRKLDELQARPISGSEGGMSPFLSPDDLWVGFWADGKLKKLPVNGGVATELCDLRLPFGFSWGIDNQIVFPPGWEGGLLRISADGGKPVALTIPDKSRDECSHRLPHCLPAGKGILFTITRSVVDPYPSVAILERGSSKWRVLLEDAADARYVTAGYLAFMRHGTLMLAPFDLNGLQINGQPFPAIGKVIQALNTGSSNLETGAGQFSISASGSMTFAAGGVFPDREHSLVWVDHKGNLEIIAPFKTSFGGPRLSPDGRWIAYFTSGERRHVWVYDASRDTASKLTSEGIAFQLAWNPDSKRLTYGWSQSTTYNLHSQAIDGSSPMERLVASEYTQVPGAWSPDGGTLAFVQGGGTPQNLFGLDVMLFRLRDRKVTPFLNSRFEETCPEFSPNGRWIAYVSHESGRDEVYVQGFPGPGGRLQVSNDGGTEPLWSRNGRQLYYRHQNQVWTVDVQPEPAFAASKPRLLFERPGYGLGTPVRNWDISADGQRFLMVKVDERKFQPVTELVLIQNWFEELRRHAPPEGH